MEKWNQIKGYRLCSSIVFFPTAFIFVPRERIEINILIKNKQAVPAIVFLSPEGPFDFSYFLFSHFNQYSYNKPKCFPFWIGLDSAWLRAE